MTWLFENPVPVVGIGIVTLAILAGAVIHTGRRGWLAAMAAVGVILAAVLLVERLVVTETEEVEAMLHALARALERNDEATVLPYISSDSTQLRSEAKQQLAHVIVHSASIKRNLKVTIGSDRGAPLAKAEFNAVAVISDKHGVVAKQTIARYFVVHLRKEEGSWRVVRYEDLDPIKRR
jgi:flagellar motor component MotA